MKYNKKDVILTQNKTSSKQQANRHYLQISIHHFQQHTSPFFTSQTKVFIYLGRAKPSLLLKCTWHRTHFKSSPRAQPLSGIAR